MEENKERKDTNYSNDYICFLDIFAKIYSQEEYSNSSTDLQSLENFSYEILEFFIPQLVGYYIVHNEFYNQITQNIKQLVFDAAARYPRISHIIYWNIISCKSIYKKYLNLKDTKDLLKELIALNKEIPNNDFPNYESIFKNIESLDEFIDKNLLNTNNDFEKFDESIFNGEKLKLKGEKKKELDEKSIESFSKENYVEESIWKCYTSTISFFDDLIFISDVLRKNKDEEVKMKMLMNFIKVINKSLPAEVYIPTDIYSKSLSTKQSVLRICEEKAFCFFTKERVPFHVFVEIVESDEEDLKSYRDSVCGRKILKHEENKVILKDYNEEDKESSFKMLKNFFCSLFFQTQPIVNAQEIKSLYGHQSFSGVSNDILKKSPFPQHKNKKIVSMIVKGGEDMRQDQFVSQLIQLFNIYFNREKVNLFLKPINIITTGRGGIIQTLTNTISIDKIKKDNQLIQDLAHYYSLKFGGYGTKTYKRAVLNFVYSLAGYSLLSYILQIKDRHNGNILIDEDGFLIHIDFGFLLNASPGNVDFEKSPFKMTGEYIDLLEGIDSKYFKEFKNLFYKGFLILRDNYQSILSFIEMFMFCNSDLPCFKYKEDIIDGLKDRLMINCSNEEMKVAVNKLIDTSCYNWRTKVYDGFQKYCVGISS